MQEDRDQIGQTLGGPELRFLGFAADLRILWNTSIFHLKAYHSSFSMASAREPTGRSVISFHSIFFLFFGVPRSSAWIRSARVAFLLSDRRQDANLAIPDLENGFVRIAVAVSNVDAMQRFGRDLLHLVGDRVIAVASQAVDAGPDQEMRSGFLGRAESS
jgi:hypothetical protein